MTSAAELLPSDRYAQVFRVLEQCDAAQTLSQFQNLVLDSLQSVFGFEHVTCFAGNSVADAFNDREPLLRGRTVECWEEYRERWCGRDVLSVLDSKKALLDTGFSQLRRIRKLPTWSRPYVDDYLRRWDLPTASAMHLKIPAGGHALVGIFGSEHDLISGTDEATLRLLARHLSAMSRRMPLGENAVLPDLPERLADVASRLCDGLPNAQIADELHLQLDTVKKYVSRLLAATSTSSRAEFIARYQ